MSDDRLREAALKLNSLLGRHPDQWLDLVPVLRRACPSPDEQLREAASRLCDDDKNVSLVVRLRSDYAMRFKEEQPFSVIYDYEQERHEAADTIDRLQSNLDNVRVELSDKSIELDRLTRELSEARGKLVRDGSSCGCQWTFKDLKDLDGTLTRECAFHADQRKEARSAGFEEAREEAAKVADALAAELSRLKGSSDWRVQIGSHLETCATIAAAIRSLPSLKERN